MDSAGSAEIFAALQAELSAKSSRIAELEARVSLLEAENARLREAKGEAPDLTGEEDPIFGRLEESLVADKQIAAEKPGAAAGSDVLVLSDDEDGIAVDAGKGRSPDVGVLTREREDVEEGSESNKKEAHCDSNVSLEDDDVSVMPLRKKRSAARVVTSDSEDEDMGVCELESGQYDDHHQEGVTTRSRKRALHRVSGSDNKEDNEAVDASGSKRESCLVVTEMESEDEDDRIPISQVLRKRKIRKDRASDDDELGDLQGSSPPKTRRSARLDKKRQAAPRVLNFVEPNEYKGSEDDTDEDDDMDDFINDGDPSEDDDKSAETSSADDASALNEVSSPEQEEVNNVMDYKEVMNCIGRKKKDRDWNLEGDMLAAFRENPELCLKAVCAIYRKQTEDEQLEKSALFHNKQGFSHIHATRGSVIAEFLLDGDPHGPLKKTIDDLVETHDYSALEFCQMVASHYSKQLFAIYQNKEDPYFHP